MRRAIEARLAHLEDAQRDSPEEEERSRRRILRWKVNAVG